MYPFIPFSVTLIVFQTVYTENFMSYLIKLKFYAIVDTVVDHEYTTIKKKKMCVQLFKGDKDIFPHLKTSLMVHYSRRL